jgi:hypothetical protein
MATRPRRTATTTFIGARLPNAVVDALQADAKARRITFTRALLQAVLASNLRLQEPVKQGTHLLTDAPGPFQPLNTPAPRYAGNRRSDIAAIRSVRSAHARGAAGLMNDAAGALDGSRRVATGNIHPDDRPFTPKRR